MNKTEMMITIAEAAVRVAVKKVKHGHTYTEVIGECGIEVCGDAVVTECNRYGYRYSDNMKSELATVYQQILHSTVRTITVKERCRLVPMKNGKEEDGKLKCVVCGKPGFQDSCYCRDCEREHFRG